MSTEHLPGAPVIALREQVQVELSEQQAESIRIINAVGMAGIGRAPIDGEPIGKGAIGCGHRPGKDVVVYACQAPAGVATEVDDLDAACIGHQACDLKGARMHFVQAQNREWVGVRSRRKGVERARVGQARSPYSISHLASSACSVSAGKPRPRSGASCAEC